MEYNSQYFPHPRNHQPTAIGWEDSSLRVHARPLSDIREITEPNLVEPTHRRHPTTPSRSRPRGAGPTKHEPPSRLPPPFPPPKSSLRPSSRQAHDQSLARLSRRSEDHSSIYSIPLGNIPPRSSSKAPHNARSAPNRRGRNSSVARGPPPLPSPDKGPFHVVKNNSQAQSPVKEAIYRMNLRFSENLSRIPSKTIVKVQSPSTDHILDTPTIQHPRIVAHLLVGAPLFVGGSSVEGSVRIVVDEAERVRHRKLITLERVSIDLLGVEEVMQPSPKRHVFLHLGNELVDNSHPPPDEMVESQEPLAPTQRSWILIPSVSKLKFLLKLPLNVGPPPFQSKLARIRYILCATLIIKDAGRQLSVRCSQDTALLSVQDPERALVSLPSPLTATEEVSISRSRKEVITVTAGIHRQVWVSGTNLFADVHIVNNSRKTVRKVELRLDRVILCYSHAAAATLETSASGARMFAQKQSATIAKTSMKPSEQGWNSVLPFTTVLRTCGLEIPRGHASVSCHSFFEVRYYLYISISTTRTNLVTAQLPVQIIHMNSLDVPTNFVAQVAAAIEERRGDRSVSRASRQLPLSRQPSKMSLQGRAFAAPRTQSLNRAHALRASFEETSSNTDDILHPLPHERTRTPGVRSISSTLSFKTPPSKRKGRVFGAADAEEISRRLQHMRKASYGSAISKHSTPQGMDKSRNRSALGFYSLEEDQRLAPSRASGHIGPVKLSHKPSVDFPRPPTSTRGNQRGRDDQRRG